jgi:hypothetical protein
MQGKKKGGENTINQNKPQLPQTLPAIIEVQPRRIITEHDRQGIINAWIQTVKECINELCKRKIKINYLISCAKEKNSKEEHINTKHLSEKEFWNGKQQNVTVLQYIAALKFIVKCYPSLPQNKELNGLIKDGMEILSL